MSKPKGPAHSGIWTDEEVLRCPAEQIYPREVSAHSPPRIIRTQEVTWNGDDGDVVIGHHPWRAAFLHIEMRRLEKLPTNTNTSSTPTKTLGYKNRLHRPFVSSKNCWWNLRVTTTQRVWHQGRRRGAGEHTTHNHTHKLTHITSLHLLQTHPIISSSTVETSKLS